MDKFYCTIVIQVKAKDITNAVDVANDVINYTSIDSPLQDHGIKLVQFSVQPEQKGGK